jgi:hypothetical protein
VKTIPKIICASILCLSLFVPHSFAASDERNEITIVIPARVIAKFINDVLPIKISKGKKFSGVIWVKSVDKLQLEIDKASFSVNVHGEDITYTGKLGKLSTSLHFGTIDASFSCDASIRYDKEKNILYVRPKIVERGNRNKLLLPLLLQLIDKEYPVELQKLKPIITKFGDKSVTLDMDISNVYTVHDRLLIAVSPHVRSEKR